MAESSYIDRDTERGDAFPACLYCGSGQAGLLAVLCGRLVWLQVAQGTRYKTLAEENRIDVKIIAPSRGQIVDRFGVPLAVNNQNFRALIVPERTDDLERSLRTLATHIDPGSRRKKTFETGWPVPIICATGNYRPADLGRRCAGRSEFARPAGGQYRRRRNSPISLWRCDRTHYWLRGPCGEIRPDRR